MKIHLTIIATIFSFSCLYAQEIAPLNSSRPGQAFTPLTVGKSAFQLQSGFRVAETWQELEGLRPSFYHFATFSNNTTLRYGISDRVELRSDIGWSKDYERLLINVFNPVGSGFQRLSFGSRILLMANEEKSQYLSVQPTVGIPAGDGFGSDGYGSVQLLVAYSRPLVADLTLTANVAYSTFTDEIGDGSVGYVLNVAFPITNKLSGFVEHYASVIDEEFLPSWDGGLAFLVSPNLQIDLSGGFGKVDTFIILGMHQWFLDTGVSWRIFDGASKRS